jgi:hypothetical protein
MRVIEMQICRPGVLNVIIPTDVVTLFNEKNEIRRICKTSLIRAYVSETFLTTELFYPRRLPIEPQTKINNNLGEEHDV